MFAALPMFWQWWVVGLTLIGLLFLLALVVRVYFPRDDQSPSEVVWDETLGENAAPPPKWWFWLMLAALFFSVLYLIAYPGFGNYNGLFDLTTAKQYSENRARIDNQYGDKLAALDALDIADLRTHEDAMQLAANLFDNNCANCHGRTAQGQANLFPNLADYAWQWGGDAEQIRHTIAQGRIAIMPGWQAALGGADNVAKMATFVRNFTTNQTAPEHAATAQQYQQFCAACHAANGAGNPLLGAPNLTDDAWLYGNTIAAITHSIGAGRNGVMPAQNGRLTELQIKLLTAWLTR